MNWELCLLWASNTVLAALKHLIIFDEEEWANNILSQSLHIMKYFLVSHQSHNHNQSNMRAQQFTADLPLNYVFQRKQVETLFGFSKKPPHKNSTEKGLQLSIQITVWFSIECKIAPIFTQDTVNLLPVLIQDVLKQSTSYQN